MRQKSNRNVKRNQKQKSNRNPKIKVNSPKHVNISSKKKKKKQECIDFNCGVAVWLQDLRFLTHEDMMFLNYEAKELGCMNMAPALRSGTKQKGMKFFFTNPIAAFQFCSKIPDTTSPAGNYPYKSVIMGNFLKDVQEVESSLLSENNKKSFTIIVENLIASKTIAKEIVDSCKDFGRVLRHQVYEDLGKNFEFYHLAVTYKNASEAYAAWLCLDGKLISEMELPLTVDIIVDENVRNLKKEMFKRNKMIFQP